MRARFIDVGGVRTRFLHAGSGPAVILLHGVGVSGDTFFRNIDELAQGRSIYAPDMLGHGFTDAVTFTGGPQVPTVQHLGQLADALGLERYSVIGSSYGALIAALMWFDRPSRVDNLVLVGSGSCFHPAEEQRETLRAALANATQALADPTMASCRARLAAICHDPNSVAEEILLTQLTSYALPDRFDAYKATVAGLIDTVDSDELRILSRLEQLTARTLILVGRNDIRADWRRHVEARQRMPNARLSISENCGHLPYMEHPAAFNETVGAFLGGADVGE
jgi:2-hydroxy-6-oxonona-2,4-dienedioate hydrolase